MKATLAACVLGAGLAFAVIAATVGIQGSASEPSRVVAAGADHDSGRAVFARMGCGACHTLAAAGSLGEMGPDLDQRLPSHTRASLVERITRGPSADGTFSPMPDNFGDRLNDEELDALVDFLLAARSAR